jgi:ribonuclease P protein component
VSRRVGGAVERNRVKRVLREAFDAESVNLPADHDYVVVARPDVRDLAERDGLAGARKALVDLIERAGLGLSAGEAAASEGAPPGPPGDPVPAGESGPRP